MSNTEVLVGVMKDNLDERDFVYTKRVQLSSLPRKVDLIKWVGEIENQLDTGSCVANASVSALELMAARRGTPCDLSRLFVYWNIREPYTYLRGKDKGAYLRDGFKMINKLGVPSEDIWEFDLDLLNIKPTPEVYTKAKDNKVVEYKRISRKDIPAVKDALAAGYPVIISTAIGKQFLDLKGPIASQKYGPVNTWSNKLVGYHAITIVGYDDNLRSFTIENSWGDQWGDEGLGKFPYINLVRDGLDVWVCTNFKLGSTDIEPVVPIEPIDPAGPGGPEEDEENNDIQNKNKFALTEVKILKKIIGLYRVISTFMAKN